MAFGLIFGLLGRGLFLAGFQQQLSIVIGILIVAFVLVPEKVLAQYTFSKPIYRIILKVKSSLGNQLKSRSYKALFSIGILNGLLPCGLVYTALFGATAMQDELLGMSYMLLYGLGTIPMMSGIVYVSNLLTVQGRNKIQKIIPFVAVSIGILFILRGLGLGIEYLSPSNMSLFVQNSPTCK